MPESPWLTVDAEPTAKVASQEPHCGLDDPHLSSGDAGQAPPSADPVAGDPFSADEAERLAIILEATGNFRVLRRVGNSEAPLLPLLPSRGRQVGVVLDCETTGLDPEEAEIVELAMVQFEFDSHGIGRVLGAMSSLQEPSKPIPPEITSLTGLRDGDVAGHAIDNDVVEDFVAAADVVIAHHASFDRRFVEHRWPSFQLVPWACSLTQVPWRDEGFEAARLKLLLAEAGYFHRGHRALDDAMATLHLLGLPLPRSGRTPLDCLVERANAPSARVWAIGAPFEAKDLLKKRGFRWSDGSCGPRAWNADLPWPAAEAELEFLATHVYCGPSSAIAVPVTAFDRFTDRAGLPRAASAEH